MTDPITPATDAEIATLRSLSANAAGCPWSWEPDPPTLYSDRVPGYHGLNLLGRLDLDRNGKANLDLIVAMRNALPGILDRLDQETSGRVEANRLWEKERARREAAESERDQERARADSLEACIRIARDNLGAEIGHDMTPHECQSVVRFVHDLLNQKSGEDALLRAWARAEKAEGDLALINNALGCPETTRLDQAVSALRLRAGVAEDQTASARSELRHALGVIGKMQDDAVALGAKIAELESRPLAADDPAAVERIAISVSNQDGPDTWALMHPDWRGLIIKQVCKTLRAAQVPAPVAVMQEDPPSARISAGSCKQSSDNPMPVADPIRERMAGLIGRILHEGVECSQCGEQAYLVQCTDGNCEEAHEALAAHDADVAGAGGEVGP